MAKECFKKFLKDYFKECFKEVNVFERKIFFHMRNGVVVKASASQ